MYDVIVACCRWLENTPWGATIRDSSWMQPVVLWVHFIGLSLWLATSLAVDLRLIGVGARRHTATELSNRLAVWKWIGFSVAFVAGVLLLSAEATVYVTNTGFLLKLGVLAPLALIWHVVVQKKTRAWTEEGHTSPIGQWAGVLELLLWALVVAASVGYLLTNAVTRS